MSTTAKTERPTRTATSKIPNLNEEILADMASSMIEPSASQASSPLLDPTGSDSGPKTRENTSLAEEPSDYPLWMQALVKRIDEMEAKFDKRFDKIIAEMERKIIAETERKFDEKADEKLRDQKEKIIDELNTNIIKRVKEGVQGIKDEMECKIREVDQKWEKEHNELCQWIAESEGE